MRDLLVKVCEVLAQRDLKKFEGFIDDVTMKGTKRAYFGKKSVYESGFYKNMKVPGTKVYVWTNMNCNQMRNVMKKMLKKYGIDFNELKIYLKADYKDLHPVE